MTICIKCGKYYKYRSISGACQSCIRKANRDVNAAILAKERQKNKQKMVRELVKKHDMSISCDTEICDILKAHHEILNDDPERLTSDFMLDMICSDSRRKNNYRIKRAFQAFGNMEKIIV